MTADTREPHLADREPLELAVRRRTVRLDALTSFYDSVYPEVARVCAAQGVRVAGAALALYHRFDPDAGEADVAAGFPVDRPVRAQDDVVPVHVRAGRVAALEHAGSYAGLGAAHARLRDWVAAQGLATGHPFRETYLTEPAPDADPEAMRTLIEYPLV